MEATAWIGERNAASNRAVSFWLRVVDIDGATVARYPAAEKQGNETVKEQLNVRPVNAIPGSRVSIECCEGFLSISTAHWPNSC